MQVVDLLSNNQQRNKQSSEKTWLIDYRTFIHIDKLIKTMNCSSWLIHVSLFSFSGQKEMVTKKQSVDSDTYKRRMYVTVPCHDDLSPKDLSAMLRYFKRFVKRLQASNVSTVSYKELCDLTVFCLEHARSMLLHSQAMLLLCKNWGRFLIFSEAALDIIESYCPRHEIHCVKVLNTGRATDFVTTLNLVLHWGEIKEQGEDVNIHRNSYDFATHLEFMLFTSIWFTMSFNSNADTNCINFPL